MGCPGGIGCPGRTGSPGGVGWAGGTGCAGGMGWAGAGGENCRRSGLGSAGADFTAAAGAAGAGASGTSCAELLQRALKLRSVTLRGRRINLGFIIIVRMVRDPAVAKGVDEMVLASLLGDSRSRRPSFLWGVTRTIFLRGWSNEPAAPGNERLDSFGGRTSDWGHLTGLRPNYCRCPGFGLHPMVAPPLMP